MSAILALKLNDYELRPRGNDQLWKVMREVGSNGRTFTVKDIEKQTRRQRFQDVQDYVRRLEKANILECVGKIEAGAWKGSRQFKLAAAPRLTPSVDRSGKQVFRHRGQTQMWNAMRSLERFSKHDLALSASTEECDVKVSTAQRYIGALKTAGYFLILQESRPGHAAYYRLRPDMKTGPLPPRILRTKVVYDQNRNEIVGPVEFDEVAA